MVFLAALFPSLTLSQEGISCKRENNVLICELHVLTNRGAEKLNLSHCIDDFCFDAQVTITKSGSASADTSTILLEESNGQEESNRARDAAATSTTADLVIAGRTYSPPFSQYGVAVAESLQSRPTATRSWQYGDWLIQFAVALRGDPSSLDMNPVSIQEAVAALELSVKVFEDMQNSGMGDAKVSIANAYMTMAETFVFDPYDPQYSKAMHYFELSNKLFKEVLDEKEIPIGFTRGDVELNWADTSVRVAVLLVDQQIMEEKDQQLKMDLNSMDAAFDVSQLSGGAILSQQMSDTVTRSEGMLKDAVATFRQLVSQASSPSHVGQRRIRLANALQNLASISAMKGANFDESNALLEESVTNYMDSLAVAEISELDRSSAISGVAESLYSLSDGYLQAGKYEQATGRYRDTLNWYKSHKLNAPAVADIYSMDEDQTLQATEQALAEYNAMVHGQGEIHVPNDWSRHDGMYQADELYEADLHATLGALRMARNEMHLAINHLANAIEKYARNPESGRLLADAKLNLATAYFKQGEYELSMEAHDDALDVYKEVVGEGKNPLMEGLEDMLAHHGVDIEAVKQGVTVDSENEESNRLIDVGAYQASILNKTAFKTDEL